MDVREPEENIESSTNFVYILQCSDGTLYTGMDERYRKENPGS